VTGPPSAEGLLRAERQLQAAQLAGDVVALDRLLDDRLVAIGPDGARYTKGDDLAGHRSGSSVVSELIEEHVELLVAGATGVTFFTGTVGGDLRGPPDVGPVSLYAHLGPRRRDGLADLGRARRRPAAGRLMAIPDRRQEVRRAPRHAVRAERTIMPPWAEVSSSGGGRPARLRGGGSVLGVVARVTSVSGICDVTRPECPGAGGDRVGPSDARMRGG